MLIKDVAETFAGRVEFVSENWGDSKLAERYGVKRYPAVFVDDILIAGPSDFGWLGSKGKYIPWKDEANHQKFKNDLTRMIDLVLRGQKSQAAMGQTTTTEEPEISVLPNISAQDIAGQVIDSKLLAGHVVIVEFWATWCPPCKSTLGWLGELKKQYGDKVVVLAVAVESEELQVRELVSTLKSPLNFVMGTNELVTPFGTLGSVPRMFVFDQQGRTAGIFYGATPDLHERVGGLVKNLN